MRMKRMKGLVVLGALLVGACDSGTEPLRLERIEDVTFDASLEVNLAEMTRTDSGLYYQDIVEGEGALAESGAQVNVRYLLRYRNGFTQDEGEFPFTLDSGASIAGFNEGVKGMRVGGERKLVVPPELGYNQPGPNGILIFDIELLEVVAP